MTLPQIMVLGGDGSLPNARKREFRSVAEAEEYARRTSAAKPPE